jgi:hypothetical protein
MTTETPGRRALLAMLLICAMVSRAIAADSEYEAQTPSPSNMESPAGHGWVSIQAQDLYSHGDYDGPAGANSGNVRFYSLQLNAAYFVANHWDIHLGIPYISSQYTGQFAHPQLPCPPNCAPTEIDNGRYHGYWQDWDAGVRYHADIDGYEIAPSLDVYVPSNNYPYYGSASIGQRTRRVGLGFDLSHQFDFSNIFYVGHYQYVFDQHVLGINNNYSSFGLDLGYFLTPHLSVRGITDVKLGNGYADSQIGPFAPGPGAPTNGANPIWELHDKFRLQEHADIGATCDYVVGLNMVSLTAAHSFWGNSDSRLTYAVSVMFTRSF